VKLIRDKGFADLLDEASHTMISMKERGNKENDMMYYEG